MPVRIEFIESQAQVEACLPMLEALLTDGLIEAQDTTVLKSAVADSRGGRDCE